MHVVYREMPCGGAKSNVAKWNLSSRIQFKHVKKITLSSCRAVIGYIQSGLWTLFSLYVMECKLFGVCVVRKGAGKTHFKLKIIYNKNKGEPFTSR